MTGKEAYELMVKYSGEEGLFMLREMVHNIGIEGTIVVIQNQYEKKGGVLSDEFKDWIRLSLNYMDEQNKQLN